MVLGVRNCGMAGAIRTRSTVVRLLVGADGAQSAVRRGLGLEDKARLARPIEVVGPVDSSVAPEFAGPTAIFDFGPMAHGVQGFVWHFPCVEHGATAMNRGIYDSRYADDLRHDASSTSLSGQVRHGLHDVNAQHIRRPAIGDRDVEVALALGRPSGAPFADPVLVLGLDLDDCVGRSIGHPKRTGGPGVRAVDAEVLDLEHRSCRDVDVALDSMPSPWTTTCSGARGSASGWRTSAVRESTSTSARLLRWTWRAMGGGRA
jgi:hypothetical protein